MNRRDFLVRASTLALGGLLPAGCAIAPKTGPSGGSTAGQTVVLIELNGGNDGLNTVVPYTDPKYYELRPKLAVAKTDVLRLNDTLGFNPALKALQPVWDKGELAVVLGTGYPQPNRSHFRSIEIWDTGSNSDEFADEGWLARYFALRRLSRPSAAADGVVFGRPYVGPMVGTNARVVVLDDPATFARQARQVQMPGGVGANPALEHVMRVQAEAKAAGADIEKNLARMNIKTEFPRSGIGGQMRNAARLVASGLDIPVVKVSQGGFDNHSFQRTTHDRLLREVAEAMTAFRLAMIESGMWDRVLVMTYSEFGRRPAENRSEGTDHGTAAPHFIMAPRIKGGFHGRQPALTDLADGDLKHTVDFRSVYATVLNRWWGVESAPVLGRAHAEVGFLV